MDASTIAIILGISVSAITIYSFVHSQRKRPDLAFDVKDCYHWYDEENKQSGLNLHMFIHNKGNIQTTIKSILPMFNRDSTQRFFARTKPLKVGAKVEEPFNHWWSYEGEELTASVLDIIFSVEHTYRTEYFVTRSYYIKGYRELAQNR